MPLSLAQIDKKRRRRRNLIFTHSAKCQKESRWIIFCGYLLLYRWCPFDWRIRKNMFVKCSRTKMWLESVCPVMHYCECAVCTPTCSPPHLQNLQTHRLVSQSNKFNDENVFLSRLKPWLPFLDILLWSEATIATFRSPTQYPCPVDWWGRIFRREWRFSRNSSDIRIHHIVAIFISALIALLTGRAIFVVVKKSRKVVRGRTAGNTAPLRKSTSLNFCRQS